MRKRKVRNFFISMLIVLVLVGLLHFKSDWLGPARAQLQDLDDFKLWKTVGIIPSQKVRITVANLSTVRTAQPFSVECIVLDQNGTRVFRTTLEDVPPQGFRFQDILFEDLTAVTGDPVTLRKQIAIVLLSDLASGSQPFNIHGALEVIDTTTGATTTSQGWGKWEVSLTRVVGGR